jgi:SGNH domain (fused to AT3 domains)
VIARVGGVLACVPIVLPQVGPAAAAPAQQPPSPQRILVIGDSTAATLFPFLRDAGSARGIPVAQAARIGCGVIARQHADKVGLIDLPTMLACPVQERCPAEVAPGIRPGELDGFHFAGDGAVWLADQLMGVLTGTAPPPTPPGPQACAAASVGNGSAAAGGGKCAQ